jgi:hypothetical protein
MILFCALPAAAIDLGGTAELFGAAGTGSGNIYRRLARADLVAEHASGSTSLKLDLRAEYDSARSSSAGFSAFLDQPVSASGNFGHDSPQTAAALVEDKKKAEQQRVYLRELYINHDLFSTAPNGSASISAPAA